jgi:hypothetical protein
VLRVSLAEFSIQEVSTGTQQLLFRFRIGWKIRGVDRLTVHRLGEVEKQLRQVALGLETVRARTVIPFLQAIEFYLQTQIL